MKYLQSLWQNKNLVAALLVATAISLVQFSSLDFLGLTNAQEITCAILVIAAALWISEWVPLFVVSFLILALEIIWLQPALTAGDITVAKGAFYGSFFSNIILLFLGGFVLSSLMQKFGLDIRFAQAILAKTKGNSSLTLLGII
jgi:sodium-dependent dicarboxylate transporter 2/3/5